MYLQLPLLKNYILLVIGTMEKTKDFEERESGVCFVWTSYTEVLYVLP